MESKTGSLILIVDDNKENREILSLLIGKKGYQTIVAASGKEALEIVSTRPPDLILLDIMMPEMDGFETCHRLKMMEGVAQIPVIFVTALARDKNIEKAFEAGGSDYITKPFIREEVFVRINLHINLRKANKRVLNTMADLEKSRDDLLAVLDQLRVKTLIIDTAGFIQFVSASCEEIEGLKRDLALNNHWMDILPLSDDSKEQLQHIINLPPGERDRATLILESIFHKLYWMDVEVREDPRHPERSIICLYDMTEIHTLRDQVRQSNYVNMVGNSQPMLEMYEMFDQVSEGDWTVLIEGETGSGKELVARSIHASSQRRNGPFIAVNCAGLSESLLASQLFGHRRGAFTGAVSDQTGFFEAAEKGSLFLDEIGDIPMGMQASLLRALQEHEIIRIGENRPKKIDVRILTATNQNLGDLVQQGLFREDLLYRIRVARIRVPPLRERNGDIPVLLNTFLSERRISMGKPAVNFGVETMQILTGYRWPGNVRELKNIVDHCIIHCKKSVIQPDDLPPEVRNTAQMPVQPATPQSEQVATAGLPASITEVDETAQITTALSQAKGNRTRAAKLLGISRATLYRRLEQLHIEI
ncbi:MAG: sigma-54-dependent Fis family transcriptional regulator [Deltaproteobacteria bacterium]|nr:sigma-54-dependent Fis family transcriptional regulator [Deltaproteobacteria bacterium]